MAHCAGLDDPGDAFDGFDLNDDDNEEWPQDCPLDMDEYADAQDIKEHLVEGSHWSKSLYKSTYVDTASVYTAFVEARERGLDPCVLSRPYSANRDGKEFCCFSSRQVAADFVAAKPKQRRYYFEKIMVGHCDAEKDCLRGVPTMPYIDYDLKLSPMPECDRPSWQTCLRDVVEAFAHFLEEHYGYRKDRSSGDYTDMAVMGACTAEKVSFHIVLRSACIVDRRCFRNHLAAYRGTRAQTWGVTMHENPDLAPYGKTQDFRLPLNCKRSGARNYLEPIVVLTSDGAQPAFQFAKWPCPTNDQILFGMVCEVGLDAKAIEPTVHLPPGAPHRRRGDDARRQSEGKPEQASSKFTAAVMQVLQQWEMETFGSHTDALAHHWVSDSELYVRNGRAGCHHCPHGHTYHKNNFMLRVSGHSVEYGCLFTREAGAGQCAGNLWTAIGDLPGDLLRIPRTTYTYEVEGRARVRPFPMDFDTIVEASEMGMGKTFQLIQLVERLGRGASVLIVLHRITLCVAVMGRLADLGFQLYSDTQGPISGSRVVVCIDSLWKIEWKDFSLVCVDETPQVLASAAALRSKHGTGGKWRTWDKLVSIIRNAERRIFMSAQSDSGTRIKKR